MSRWVERISSLSFGAIAIRNVRRTVGLLGLSKRIEGFEGSQAYWEKRYQSGGNSGLGSYGDLAKFKADVLNDFVAMKCVATVIEFGCGDGHQLSLARYPNYIGFDVSYSAIARCKKMFADDASKQFKSVEEYEGEQADAVLSLDVIYHLVEDPVFERYLATVFDSARNWVVIYSSNFEGVDEQNAAHVRHRRFMDWIDVHRPEWKCIRFVKNRFSFTGDITTSSHADFYFFSKASVKTLEQ